MSIKFLMNLFLVCSFMGLSSCGRGKTSSESDDAGGKSGTVASVTGKEERKSPAGGDAEDTSSQSDTSSPASGRGDGDASPPSSPSDPATKPEESLKTESIPFKKMEIVLSESFKPLSKQIARNGLLKGQSDAFAFYIQHWFDVLNLYKKGEEVPPNPMLVRAYEAAVNILCPDPSKCEGGLNLKKVDKFVIDKFISFLPFITAHLFFDKEGKGTTLAFTQGLLSPPDSLTVRRNLNPEKWEERPSIQLIRSVVQEIAKRNIKDIIINFPVGIPSHDKIDFLPFFYLGEVIKKQEIDLHIIGYCDSYCVNYLLPAAKTVYVEPFYGYISTKGSFNGLADNAIGGRELPEFLEDWKRELDKNLAVEEERKNFIVKSFEKLEKTWFAFNMATPMDISFPRFLLEVFSTNDSFAKGTGEALVAEQQEFVNQIGKPSFVQLTEKEMLDFVAGLPPELSDNLFSGVYKVTEKQTEQYFNNLQISASEESDYYDKINVKNLQSKKPYGFLDFLYIPARLVWQPTYEQFLPFLPRPYYNISEGDKSYWVAPSTELLRELGLDVRGENNVERLFDIIENNGHERDRLLYIDSEGMKNCDFFAETASFNEGTLKKCLSL